MGPIGIEPREGRVDWSAAQAEHEQDLLKKPNTPQNAPLPTGWYPYDTLATVKQGAQNPKANEKEAIEAASPIQQLTSASWWENVTEGITSRLKHWWHGGDTIEAPALPPITPQDQRDLKQVRDVAGSILKDMRGLVDNEQDFDYLMMLVLLRTIQLKGNSKEISDFTLARKALEKKFEKLDFAQLERRFQWQERLDSLKHNKWMGPVESAAIGLGLIQGALTCGTGWAYGAAFWAVAKLANTYYDNWFERKAAEWTKMDSAYGIAQVGLNGLLGVVAWMAKVPGQSIPSLLINAAQLTRTITQYQSQKHQGIHEHQGFMVNEAQEEVTNGLKDLVKIDKGIQLLWKLIAQNARTLQEKQELARF